MNVNGMVLFRKSVSTFYSFLFLNSFQFSKWVKAIVAIDARINGLWSNRTHSLGAPFRGVGPTCGHDFENGARVYRTQYGTRRDLPTRQFWRETEELHMKFFMKCKQNRHDWWNKYICLNRLPSSRRNWFFFIFVPRSCFDSRIEGNISSESRIHFIFTCIRERITSFLFYIQRILKSKKCLSLWRSFWIGQL